MNEEQLRNLLSWCLGAFDGMRGSIHEDADHYREFAAEVSDVLREAVAKDVYPFPLRELPEELRELDEPWKQ